MASFPFPQPPYQPLGCFICIVGCTNNALLQVANTLTDGECSEHGAKYVGIPFLTSLFTVSIAHIPSIGNADRIPHTLGVQPEAGTVLHVVYLHWP